MTSQRFEFPLPERALPRVRVTPEQHEELRAFAVRTAQDVLRDGPTWGRSNVNAARERGWKVSQKSSEACFMMKTTTTSKPIKSNPAAQQVFSAHTSSSISSDDSSGASSGINGSTPGSNAQRGSGGSGGRAFMGSVRLAGYTLDDVVSAIHCETTKAQRQQLSKSYGNSYLDCCIMQTLEGAKQFDPFWYLGLKWTALKTPFEKIVNYREFVYLEHSGTHINALGQRMLYRIIQSVNLDDFGGEKAYFGLTRAHLEAAYVYWMDGPAHALSAPGQQATERDGVLTVCMKGLAHPKGKVPLFLIERLMKKFWKAGWTLHTAATMITGSDNAADHSKLTLDLATQWVADADRKSCALCEKKFRFGRRMRHHCRACGEVICRSCTQYFLLTYAGSVGSNLMHEQYSVNSIGSGGRRPNPFADEDDEDDLPATLGGEGPARRGRMRVASENDAVMVGKVCRRCVEMKKVAVRRETSRQSSIRQPHRVSTRLSTRRTQMNSWENGMQGGGMMPVSIEETDEHDEDHHDFPIMGHEDEDGEFFVPETPLPSHAQPQYQSQFHHHNQHHHHGDDDDTASEFSIGDFEHSQNTTFKPFATLDLHGAHEEHHHHNTHGHGHRAHPDAGKMSIDSSFSQSGFSVGIGAHDEDSDNEDEFVDYHSETEEELASVRHPQIGAKLMHLTVQEEERFTMPKVPVMVQQQQQQPPPPPPPIAQQFALTAAALSAPRYKQDARLRIEDLLADTDDEGEEDYSTSPPMRPSALDVQEIRPVPQLVRTASAPPLHTHTAKRSAPPPLPVHHQPYMSSNNRESNMSSISFSSFDADYLIDASALDEDEDDEFMRHSTTIDGDESEGEEVLLARIQKIQDEALRRQLLSSSASSVASSLSGSMGPAIRFNRPTRTASNAKPPVSNSISLSESSTISSNESFLSAPSSLPDANGSAPAAGPPRTAKKTQKAMQKQVESSIADQAQLLYEIQKERGRATLPNAGGAFAGYPNTSITSP